MAYRTAVVRRDLNGNFLIIFPDEEAHGDLCRAFRSITSLPVQDLHDHAMAYISRGQYLQDTVEVSQEEAERIMTQYSKEHCRLQATYRALVTWKRSG